MLTPDHHTPTGKNDGSAQPAAAGFENRPQYAGPPFQGIRGRSRTDVWSPPALGGLVVADAVGVGVGAGFVLAVVGSKTRSTK